MVVVGVATGVVVDVRFALPQDTDPQQLLSSSSSFTVEWIATSVNATPCALSSSHYYDAGGWCQLCTVCPPSWYTLRMCGAGGQDAVCGGECPAGRFVAGVHDCTRTCPPGTYSPQANMSGCVPCAIGSYTAWSGATACLDCATASTGATACRPMTCVPTAGTYCPATSGDPIDCPVGYYCTGDALNDHIPCPAGTSNPLSGQSSVNACTTCATNTVTLTTGQSACRQCPAGSIYGSSSTCTTCLAGSYAAQGAVACSACSAGKVSANGAGACSDCRPGTYAPGTASSACTQCPSGTYTFTAVGGVYTVVWGATSSGQCLANPLSPAANLICLPGTQIVGSACVACPIGYYCPQITQYPQLAGQVRACPAGTSTPSTGAVSSIDCTIATPLLPFTFAQCAVTPGDVSLLTSLPVAAVTTSFDTSTVYFATLTAVYRLFLQTNTLELLAGAEGTAAVGVVAAGTSTTGTLARFAPITAIAVDLDAPTATVIVIGENTGTLRAIDIFTRTVAVMGTPGDLSGGAVGGIALRRDPSNGQRWAYASDPTGHRILAFSVDDPTQASVHVAGDVGSTPGYADSYGASALFRAPMGMAFFERSLNTSRILLIADSGNAAIRALDTVTRAVQTWFAPQDTVTPELSTPVSVAISPQDYIVYIADTGLQRLVAIQMPSYSLNPAIKILTPLTLDGVSTLNKHYTNVLPYGTLATGTGSLVGYDELLVLDGTSHRLAALVQDLLALTADGGGSIGACHLPCQVSGCGALGPAALCGNGFLDAGEACDDPKPGSGCFANNCTIREGYSCPLVTVGNTPPSSCLSPCPGKLYAPTSTYYCAQDCAGLIPPTGYTVDATCAVTDIDECVENTDGCDKINAQCINTPGAYRCECFDTFFGDGFVCNKIAYAVYTVVDIPTVASSSLAPPLSTIAADLMADLTGAYGTTLGAAVPGAQLNSGTFPNANAAQLASLFASYSLDPVFANSYARMELVTLFETNALANAVAAGVNPAGLAAALSQSLFAANTGVSILQPPKVRSHTATSFLSAEIQGGWGMNITGVTYNRSCALQLAPAVGGESVAPRGGCWQVEMIYMGGQELPRSDESTITDLIRQSKNVLYLPRIERNPDTLAALIPAQTLTMSTGMYFPCDASASSNGGRGIGSAATACCLRSFESIYRPSYEFKGYVESANFAGAVPSNVCANPATLINHTYPSSDIVFKTTADEKTNDLVIGHIEGLPSSEVRLLETLDYTIRMHRVLLVLEEGDLRQHASITSGVTGVNYNLTFFVGLANFEGTGTSVLNTKHAQQFVTVSKSNDLTISTFGANQNPLFTSETMQLVRIKVTDFFNPVKYLYYLKVTFTMPSNFQAPTGPDETLVPLSGIRLIKLSGGVAVSATSPDWMPVCSSTTGTYVYSDPALQTLVSKAQTQTCVQSDLLICNPPATLSSAGVVTFGLPLPIGFLTNADFAGAASGNPTSIQVELVVQSYDNSARTNVLSSLSMAVQLSPLGYTTVCESVSAAQTLADIIDGSIYIGTATSDSEWATTMQKQNEIQVPGVTPAKSMQFETTTVQGSVMTFAALGSPAYFEDPRYQGQSVHMNNIFSIHFLEPLGGQKGGPTPNFDAVSALFFQGKAFTSTVDPATHIMWLTPTAALLNICPLRPTVGKLACLTRIESTDAHNTLVRSLNDVVELRINDPTSVAEMKNLMAQVINGGGVTDFTNTLGAGFHAELVSKLNLNNRYRKAYVVNPVMDWSTNAIQNTQPGATSYTVATKIIAIGLITIKSASGQQLARRLLQVGLPDSTPLFEAATTPAPPQVVEGDIEHTEAMQPIEHLQNLDIDDDELKATLDLQPQAAMASWVMAPDTTSGGRRLLQTATTTESSLKPSSTATGNSVVMDIKAPGYDAVTQLCPVLGATLSDCRMIQFTAQISHLQMERVCDAHDVGSLYTLLNDGFASSLKPDSSYASNVSATLLAGLSVSGCPSTVAGRRRRLLQTTDLVIVVSHVLLKVENGNTVVDPSRLSYIGFFQNATVMQQLFAGGAVISVRLPSVPQVQLNNGTWVNAPTGHTFFGNISIRVPNVTSNSGINQLINSKNPPPNGVSIDTSFQNHNNDPFATDNRNLRPIASPAPTSDATRVAVLGINSVVALAMALTLFSSY